MRIKNCVHASAYNSSYLQEYFKQLITDSQLADHIYLFFESTIVESQFHKNQWAVNKSKAITNNLIN